jgi:hypothetical protein
MKGRMIFFCLLIIAVAAKAQTRQIHVVKFNMGTKASMESKANYGQPKACDYIVSMKGNYLSVNNKDRLGITLSSVEVPTTNDVDKSFIVYNGIDRDGHKCYVVVTTYNDSSMQFLIMYDTIDYVFSTK